MRSSNRLLIALLAFVLSCGPPPQQRASVVPTEADVALGATHDLLILSCADQLSLIDFVLPVAATAFFVGMGRLDAAIYLPEALAEASIPKCKPVKATVTDAAFSGDSFELEATGNPRAFKAHTRQEGSATFTAKVTVDKEIIEVSSSFRSWKVNRVVLAPVCETVDESLPGWIPAGGGAMFSRALFHDDKPLDGYGYFGVNDPRLTLNDDSGLVTGQITKDTGTFTLTSPDDPTFALTLTAYDAKAFDQLTLNRLTNEVVFVGARTEIQSVATIGGKVPCISGFPRTVQITTPTVCGFRDASGDPAKFVDQLNHPVDVEALAPGTCSLNVAMEGSALTAALSFPVFRSFETIELPEAAKQPAISMTDFWVQSDNEMFVVGWKDDLSGNLQSATLRRTSGQWGPLLTTNTPRHLQAVHGAAGSVFAVGNNGQGSMWTGTSWSAFDAGVAADLNDVWVRSATEAYAVGGSGTFVRYDGSEWSALDAGVTSDLRSVWGDSAGNVYAVGWNGVGKKWDGAEVTELFPAGMMDGGFHANDISGTGPDDLWVLSNTAALHLSGGTWTRPFEDSDSGTSFLQAQPMSGGFTYLLVYRNGQAYLDRYDGTRTVAIPVPGAARAITAVGNDVYVFNEAAVLKYRHDPTDVFP
ncbi:MAG: WD40/YVTN/BNR-like repeat-containing protein [Myxococcaceae bacterium]